MDRLKEIIEDGFRIALSLLVPSMLAILGGVLITHGLIERQVISILSGVLWIATDYVVFGDAIYDFFEDIRGFLYE